MTLIVGIKCQDGIVVGSDGARTGQVTRQAASKLHVIGSKLILGPAGSAGVGQDFVLSVQHALVNNKKGWPNIREAREGLRKAMYPHVEQAAKSAALTLQATGQTSDYITHALVALATENEPHLHLLFFDHNCQPFEAPDTAPFITIGSGSTIADPFLSFIKLLYWPNALPTIGDGVFATVWTLQHTIRTNRGGVGPPISLAILQKNTKGIWSVTHKQEEELGEDLGMVETMENKMRQLRENPFEGEPAPAIPGDAAAE